MRLRKNQTSVALCDPPLLLPMNQQKCHSHHASIQGLSPRRLALPCLCGPVTLALPCYAGPVSPVPVLLVLVPERRLPLSPQHRQSEPSVVQPV